MAEEAKARSERARKLREEIERLQAGKPRRPRSPHEFVEEQMREASEEEKGKPPNEDG